MIDKQDINISKIIFYTKQRICDLSIITSKTKVMQSQLITGQCMDFFERREMTSKKTDDFNIYVKLQENYEEESRCERS